jgi:hypothetical protein
VWVVEQLSPVAAARVALMVEALRNASLEDVMGVHARSDANYRDPVPAEEPLSGRWTSTTLPMRWTCLRRAPFCASCSARTICFSGMVCPNYGEPHNSEHVCKQLAKVELPKSTAVKVDF